MGLMSRMAQSILLQRAAQSHDAFKPWSRQLGRGVVIGSLKGEKAHAIVVRKSDKEVVLKVPNFDFDTHFDVGNMMSAYFNRQFSKASNDGGRNWGIAQFGDKSIIKWNRDVSGKDVIVRIRPKAAE